MLETMLLAILVGAGLLVLSILTSLIAFRVGAPLLLIFLSIGLLAGEDGIGGIPFENAELAYFVGSVALAIILFDSGFGTNWRTFRTAAWPAVVLATFGVALTALFLSVAAHFLFGLPWLESLLVGAIVGSTDAAAVFFLLRAGGITIRERVRATLEVESGANDPMAIFLVTVLVELIMAGAGTESLTWSFAHAFAMQMGLGLLLGLAGGFGMVHGVNRTQLEPGLYPLVVLSSALVLFGITGLLGGSGFLAVYVAGLVAGNMRIHALPHLRRFQEGMTWLSQIVMFLTLGLLATPSEFPAITGPVLGIAFALMFIARPVAVTLCLLPFGFQRNEIVFVAWVGLRGAVSILLAILPIIGGVAQSQMLFNAAFIIVLASLLVQGWTIRPLARWLGLSVPPSIGPLEKVELELPGAASYELVAYRIAPESPVARGERIPRWARPSLVVRGGQAMRLHNAGRLEAGDYVYIFAAPAYLRLLDRLFASPLELQPQDIEFWGDLSIEPTAAIGSLARAYGFEVPAEHASMAIADFIARRLGGAAEVGDRLAFGSVELIVRAIDEKGRVTELGLALVPFGEQVDEATLMDWLRRMFVGRARRAAEARRVDAAVAAVSLDEAPAEDGQPPAVDERKGEAAARSAE
jgi:potassium/hydrogen antiporter